MKRRVFLKEIKMAKKYEGKLEILSLGPPPERADAAPWPDCVVSKRSFCVRIRSVHEPTSVSIGSVAGSVCRITRHTTRNGRLARKTPSRDMRERTVQTVHRASSAAKIPSAIVASAPLSAASASACGIEKWNACTYSSRIPPSSPIALSKASP